MKDTGYVGKQNIKGKIQVKMRLLPTSTLLWVPNRDKNQCACDLIINVAKNIRLV